MLFIKQFKPKQVPCLKHVMTSLDTTAKSQVVVKRLRHGVKKTKGIDTDQFQVQE